MKNITSATVIWLILLFVPFVVLSCKKSPETVSPPMFTNPTTVEPEPISPAPIPTPPVTSIPSSTFMKGYWDGWHGVWLGPIRWTLSDDYRQGHMLGSYDRKHKIQRYTPDQR